MNACKWITALFALSGSLSPAFGDAHTPAPGSAERKAIADGVREFVLTKMAVKKPPMKVLFKIRHLRVEGDLAWFQGTPVQENGSYLPDGYLPDVDYDMVLQSTNGGWKVKENLSRTDVPDGDELAQIKKRVKAVPSSIMPGFWRELLKR